MNDTDERSCASRGSHGDAVMTVIPLWHGGGPAVDRVFLCEREALEAKEWRDASTERGADIVPLYRSLTLTDEEREAIAWFSIYSDTPGEERHAVVLAKLLQRTN